ncbi:MAG: hypothetical protein IT429_03275 [Gemmataceae bacterium]|nr:hypothetical protein [Gemmataceae bacterium]
MRLSDFARIEGDLNRLKRDVERDERRKEQQKKHDEAKRLEVEKRRRAEEARRAALPPTVGDRVRVIEEMPADIDVGAEGTVQADNGRGLLRVAFETPEGRTRSILTNLRYLQKVLPAGQAVAAGGEPEEKAAS